jgi:hypothetical protein
VASTQLKSRFALRPVRSPEVAQRGIVIEIQAPRRRELVRVGIEVEELDGQNVVGRDEKGDRPCERTDR